MQSFSLTHSLGGGIMIGLAAALMLIVIGRIAGISGIMGGIMFPKKGDTAWRAVFVGGLIAGAVVAPSLFGTEFVFDLQASWPLIIVGGFLVGFGTRMGSGCTSGHGVCGVARFSKRSIVATLLFMASAIVTVFISRHIL